MWPSAPRRRGVVINAGKRFELLTKNPLGERTLASYAVGDGALFIRTEKHLLRVQSQTVRQVQPRRGTRVT